MTADNQPGIDEERRGDSELRVIFVEAYEVIRPFFDETNKWAGHSLDHLAFRALRERFPTLGGEQVFIIVSAAKRVFSSGRAPAP